MAEPSTESPAKPGAAPVSEAQRLRLVDALRGVVSPLWLRFFFYGPLEWAWRSLTYWHVQPFRRTEPSDAQPTTH